MSAEKQKDLDDLQKLHDNPDEQHAKSNYGDIETYKQMIKDKMAKRRGEENNESGSKHGPQPDGEWRKHRNKSQKRVANGKERMRAKKVIRDAKNEEEESFDNTLNEVLKRYAL